MQAKRTALKVVPESVTTPATDVLNAIFSQAIRHDVVCKSYAGTSAHQMHAVELSAIIASAATRRIPNTPAMISAVADSGYIFTLEGPDLREFLLPIFEESGIGRRFDR